MKIQYLIERKDLSCWTKIYESNHQDWAEAELEGNIKEYPEDQFRLIKKEVIVSYNPSLQIKQI